jgi:hypothetical protein
MILFITACSVEKQLVVPLLLPQRDPKVQACPPKNLRKDLACVESLRTKTEALVVLTYDQKVYAF